MGLLPDTKVARSLGICKKTLTRWDADPDLKFPSKIVINGRGYRDTDAVDAFIAARLKASIATERVNRGKARARKQSAEAQAGGAA
jgi:hypothetical protein